MTMHLAHPGLTFLGKRKGKHKFRNADQARKERELADLWDKKQKEWLTMSKPLSKSNSKPKTSLSPQIPSWRQEPRIPSLNTVVTGNATPKRTQTYTGNNVLGVTIVHKSCLQPVFTKQEAIDAANMRR